MNNPLVMLTGLPRLLTVLATAGRYGLLLLCPWASSPDYSLRAILPVLSLDSPRWVLGFCLVALALTGVYLLRRRPAALIGLLLMGGTFVIASNFFFNIGTIMADRLLYLPSVGFCLLAGALATGERRRPGPRRSAP